MKNVIAKSFIVTQFDDTAIPLVGLTEPKTPVKFDERDLLISNIPNWFTSKFGINNITVDYDPYRRDIQIDMDSTGGNLVIVVGKGVTKSQIIDEIYEFFLNNKRSIIIRILEFILSLFGKNTRAEKILKAITEFVRLIFNGMQFSNSRLT